MGVNLLLTHKGNVIADLGRSYYFRDCVSDDIETNTENLDKEAERLKSTLSLQLSTYLGYQPKNWCELEEMRDALEEFIEYTIEEAVGLVKKYYLRLSSKKTICTTKLNNSGAVPE